jgi:hypothetical protein
MTDPMTLAQYARRVKINYHTLYARVDRRINRGETNGLLLRVDGRLLPMPRHVWDEMTVPLPVGRPCHNQSQSKNRRKK